jgi:hypothetical protein
MIIGSARTSIFLSSRQFQFIISKGMIMIIAAIITRANTFERFKTSLLKTGVISLKQKPYKNCKGTDKTHDY